MVNKFYLDQSQREQQKQIEAKLKAGELIINNGNIILNPEWSWTQEQARLRKKYQAIKREWQQKQRKKQAEEQWQKRWSRIESCLAELWKGEKSM